MKVKDCPTLRVESREQRIAAARGVFIAVSSAVCHRWERLLPVQAHRSASQQSADIEFGADGSESANVRQAQILRLKKPTFVTQIWSCEVLSYAFAPVSPQEIDWAGLRAAAVAIGIRKPR